MDDTGDAVEPGQLIATGAAEFDGPIISEKRLARLLRRLPFWAKVVISIGTVVIVGGVLAGSIYLAQPRDSVLAQSSCVQEAVAQLSSPSTASLVEARTFGPITAVYLDEHPEMNEYVKTVLGHGGDLRDSLVKYSDVAAEAGNGPEGDNPRLGGYFVGGAIDAQNGFGATVRGYFLCATHVVGTEVTDETEVAWFVN